MVIFWIFMKSSSVIRGLKNTKYRENFQKGSRKLREFRVKKIQEKGKKISIK